MKKQVEQMDKLKAVGIPAKYCKSKIKRYRGNPLIEDLPDMLTEEKVFELFFNVEPVTEYDREQDPELRILMTEAIRDILVPNSIHLRLFRAIYQAICNGYVGRNPFRPGRVETGWGGDKVMEEKINSRNYPEYRKQKGSNAPITRIFIGVSGMGKTTCVDQILDYFPQVICHTNYNGRTFTATQITYLKVSCPPNASPEGFCLDILKAFDDAIGEKRYEYAFDNAPYGRERIKDVIGDLMENFHVGLLVIDDTNRLIKDNSDARELKELFASIIDLWKVPVLFVGTPMTQELLKANFTGIRRFNSEGIELWPRMLREEADWKIFSEVLWKMQYTKTFTPLTQELSDALYEASQGITSLTISVFRLAQQQVILDEGNPKEVITKEAIEQTVNKAFSAYKDLLEAIKENDYKKLAGYEDLVIDIHNYDLSVHGDLEAYNADRMLELQQRIIKEDQDKVLSLLGEHLRNCADMFPHLKGSDFENITEEVLRCFSVATETGTLKRKAFLMATDLEEQKAKEEAERKERKDREEEILRENKEHTRSNEYFRLYNQAQRSGKSTYSVFKENGLTGFGSDG